MNCPHCGNTLSPDLLSTSMKPMRVKNFVVNSWCPSCKKPKSYRCDLLMGVYAEDDPDAIVMPELCQCATLAYTFVV